MSTSTIRMESGRTFEVSRDVQLLWSAMPTLDPAWRFTDSYGHEHRGDTIESTLEWVELIPEHVDSEGEEWPAEGEYRCAVCGEIVVPGTHVPVGPTYVVTAEYFRIDGRSVTKEEWDRAVEEEMRT